MVDSVLRLNLVWLALTMTVIGEPSRDRLLHANGLPGLRVAAIQEMSNGVAFGTDQGLAILRNGMVTTYTGSAYDGQADRTRAGNSELPGNEVACLTLDDAGDLWIGTARGLARLQGDQLTDETQLLPRTWSSEEITIEWEGESGTVRGPSDYHDVTHLASHSDGRILVGTRNAGVIALNTKTLKAQLLFRKPDANQWTTGSASDGAGNLYVGICNYGVLAFLDDGVRLMNDEIDLPSNNVRSLAISRDGNLWVGTAEGLLRYNLQSPGDRMHYTKEVDSRNTLPWQLWTREDALWCRTDNGLVVWKRGKWSFGRLAPGSKPPPPPLSGGTIGASGDLWLADWAGVYRNPEILWSETPWYRQALIKLKQRVEATFHGIQSEAPHLARDAKGSVWIAFDGSLLSYDGRSWRNRDELVDGHAESVSSVFADSRGRIFVCTSGEGLVVVDRGQVKRYNNAPDHAKSVVYCVAEGPNGVIYAGQNSLYRLTDTWEKVIDEWYQISSMLVDRQGRVWFGDVNHGILYWDGQTVTNLSRKAGLPTFFVHELKLESDGRVRISGKLRLSDRMEDAVFQSDGRMLQRIELPPSPAE